MVAKDEKREIWLDWLRVTACFMVMATHSCEPFYLGGEGSLILTKADALWVSILNVIPRAAIALFIFTSSYLQFPLHYSAGEFFKRRAKRILVPFIFWSLVYAFVWGEPMQNLKDLIWNFNYAAGHLWFVYMLIGVYLIMPLLSPWAEKVGKRELQIYLAIWLFTTIIPLIRQWVGGPAPVMYGPSGIPNAARYPLWGEASWNAYGVFYYL
ncbi:MAG: acyltransferase, partial [Bacteroidales bacterium]|nr:acyltransferase [Bacteroidales bacterium]